MPLLQGDLDGEYLLVSPDDTIGEALQKWHARGGQDDWHLVVHWSEGNWGAIQVADLADHLTRLGTDLLRQTLAEFRDEIPAAIAVQKEDIGIGTAKKWALRQPQEMLVILSGDQIAGRFYCGTSLGVRVGPSVSDFCEAYLRQDYVTTGFASSCDPDNTLSPQTPLACGERYFFWLKVGAIDQNAIDRVTARLEVERFPTGARFYVVIYGMKNELELTNGATVGMLKLLKEGFVVVDQQPAAVCSAHPAPLCDTLYFPVKAPEREGTFHLRCNIYYNGVLIQSRIVYASVMSEPVPVESALSTHLEYRLADRPTSPSVASITPHQLSIAVSTNSSATHSFSYFGALDQDSFERDISLDESQVKKWIDRARKPLRYACYGDEDPWEDKPHQKYKYTSNGSQGDRKQLRTDLTRMAIQGHRLYCAFTQEMVGAQTQVDALAAIMREPGAVQVALMSGSARSVLPISLFYDYDLDTNLSIASDYSLCPSFVAALDSELPLQEQACFKGDCPSRGQKSVVCPSGFWGFRHQLGLPLSEAPDTDVACQITYEGAPKFTVCVSLDPLLEKREGHIAQIRGLRSALNWNEADSREDTFRALKQEATIVYFYCHGGMAGDLPYLHVGSLEEPGITPDNLKSHWVDPRPLVIINGCRSTEVQPEMAFNFADRFVRTSHASGVIGTEITVFEPLATAFGEGFLSHFLAGVPLGEAVRLTRLTMLETGNPLGLVYIPFAMTGLTLVPKAAPQIL